MSLARWAKGIQLQLDDGAGAFSTIAEVKDLTFPLGTADILDATNHDSADDWEEIIPTILRHPEVTFKVNFIPGHATHDGATGFQSLIEAKTLRGWKLILPTSGSPTYEFNAYVVGVSIAGPVAGLLEADVTLKPTGPTTIP
jgi:predicted secreted protein